MMDTIRLLPDHIANQIAAGEVVQRPASVVKELLENAIDAGAERIELILRDAGKALVQVIDDGKGMSAQDARMCFERHATSKIASGEDLFNIRTMGFRGEAMASIAAVAQIQLKTRLKGEQLGTELQIEGSEIRKQEPVVCTEGTSVSVKNLFYNVPARRNFLKSNPVETRHIMAEFTRVALACPEKAFRLEHNGALIHDLKAGDLAHRISELLGKDLAGKLVPIEEETPYLSVEGFAGTPETGRKQRGDQYFFVNGRFIKSHYLHHAVANAYENLLPQETHPTYVLFLSIDPKHVDVNIHPTKTEVKFDDERTAYSLLHSVVKKGLAGLHMAPEIDFGDNTVAEVIRNTPRPEPEPPTIRDARPAWERERRGSNAEAWNKLYSGPQEKSFPRKEPLLERKQPLEQRLPVQREEESQAAEGLLVQVGGRYILSQNREGLILIDQRLAHQRVLYERFLDAGNRPPLASQQLLFPVQVELNPEDMEILKEVSDEVRHLGFDLQPFEANKYMLHGTPAGIAGAKAGDIFQELIAEVRDSGQSEGGKVYERLAKSIALRSAIPAGKKLDPVEMRNLVDELFRCKQPGRAPDGAPTWFMLEFGALEKHFQL